MLKDDYIMRMINEMIHAVLVLLLGKDSENGEKLELPEVTEDNTFQKLIAMAGEGQINEAENMLWDLLEDNEIKYFQMALLFYDYLNDLDDDVLEQGDFSREEIADGLARVMKLYGYEDMARTFLI
ncbi:hypothetical protein HNP82_000605 [Catenibacillus scindens]|uniref:Uncharacterized protein n=1 Tax=Catenibacillus scindens TaxID=673271 RepID=A0A7W8H855_9FIRM|nr:DUF6483 family protein [Catenibacillus scindens]MBB5263507.1 hypothetical protein [Catenibacillus scindens]